MDEIRLTCESCGVQYQLPGDAIPPGGREVECTSCGHSWMARPQLKPLSLSQSSTIGDDPAEAEDDEPTGEPRLSRPLPANVLAILRDELEFERRARAAETTEDTADQPPATDAADADWPATTLRWPGPSAQTQPQPQPPAPKPETRPEAPEKPLPLAPVLVAEPATMPDPRPYRTGFGLAAMIAALFLSFYLLAPSLGDAGPLGERLIEARASIDDTRARLRASLFGGE